MAQVYTTHVIRGVLNWAKVLGQPIMNDYAKERQWSVDVSPDAKGLAELKKLKLTNKLKNKKDNRKDFISFRLGEFKKNGQPNDPIYIEDAKGNPWPKDVKIGNGSIADVKFSYTDFGSTKGSYIKAIRIVKHVPYVVQEFAPLSEDDEYFAGDRAELEPTSGSNENVAFDQDVDDEVPF